MKTTLVIDDTVMTRLREEAARTGQTISDLVEAALRVFLERKKRQPELPPLPSRKCGELLVNVASRDELYDLLEED